MLRNVTPDSLFSLATFVVLPGWLLLVFVPRWRWSARLVSGFVIPCLLGALYALVLVPRFGGAEGGFDSFAGVRKLFGLKAIVLAGWLVTRLRRPASVAGPRPSSSRSRRSYLLAFALLLSQALAGRPLIAT